jgi:hypothetical protein
VLANQPLVVLFGEECAEEPQYGLPVGKDANNRTAPLEFFVQTLERIGSVHLTGMLHWKVQERQNLTFGLFEQLHDERARRQRVAHVA